VRDLDTDESLESELLSDEEEEEDEEDALLDLLALRPRAI